MNFKKWSATRILAVGFAVIILFGAVLLRMPIANRGGTPIPFFSALFTATSATCVTGLVVYDTWSQFSLFGQAVILLLIQVGGLGFMTVAILFSLALGKRIGLRERSLLTEAVGSLQIGGVVRLVKRTLIGTAIFEGIGALLLSIRFIPLFGLWRGIWFSIFHSVSAFCNAGFDLMGRLAPSSSLTHFAADPLVILTIAGLIIVGGIGFVVWNDLVECRFRMKNLRLHTHVTLTATLALLLMGTVLFLLLEHNGVFSGMSIGERLLSAFFQSVTPRTAGFNSVDIASLTDASKLTTMLLMFVGASPGSTGGGIKTTTLVVAAATVMASLRGSEDVSVRRLRLESDVQRRACCGIAVYGAQALIGMLVLCVQGFAFTDAAFECLSAIGTVGLSTGITPALPALSKLVIILLMYTGRVGSITVFLAVARSISHTKLKNPIGKIIVG